MANAMMGMATVYLATGNTAKALPLAEEAVKLFQSHDSRLEVRDTKRLIAEIYEKAGNYLQAMIYYKQTEQLADSIFNEGLTRRLATVNFEYQEEKRLAEIAVLKKEKGIIAAQSRYRLFGIIGLVGILAGSILLLLLLAKNSRERKRVNELLQQKNTEIENQAKELKELDTYKNKVLSVVGHDLRGPLGGIKALFELMQAREMSPEDFYNLSDSLKQNIDEMYATTDNLLQWANAQMKRVNITAEIFTPRTAAEQIIKLVHPIASYKEIAIYNEIPQSLQIEADKNHFVIVLRNLVSNALKFTRTKGYVELLAVVKDGYIEFCVKDNGVGIAPVILQNLNSNTDNTLSKDGLGGEKGTGLGLKLCKDFVELNGGKLWIESELNTGTSIHFTLKKAK
jgi:signal transduction histidine kinase